MRLVILMTAVLAVQLVLVHKLKAEVIMNDDATAMGKVRASLLQAFQIMEQKNVFLPSDVLVLMLTAALASGIDIQDLAVNPDDVNVDTIIDWRIRSAD